MWERVAHKMVRDYDGFMTDYTMYQNMETGEFVCIFGDNELYLPEDGYYDAEFETEEEAFEWFESYEGFEDDGWDRWEVDSSRHDWDMDEDYYSVNLAF